MCVCACVCVQSGVLSLGQAVDVCIPTGNFGNMLGAVYARRLGLPLRRLISASNANNVINDFVQTGVYDLRQRAFTATVSPSIDILVSSNLERLLYVLTDGDTQQVAALFSALAKDGVFRIPAALLRRLQAEVSSGWCSEADCLATIRRVFEQTGQLIDPHTAVAVKVASDSASTASVPMLVSSTAHWAKFPHTMLHALTGTAQSALSDDVSTLFAELATIDRSPLSTMHPALQQLADKPVLHNRTVAASKQQVVDEMKAFFARIAQRDSHSRLRT